MNTSLDNKEIINSFPQNQVIAAAPGNLRGIRKGDLMHTAKLLIKKSRLLTFVLLALVLQAGAVRAQTSTFTYQGRFTDGGTAANGTYDMQFKLFDEGGNQIGSTITNGAVTVASGVFTVQLDYGAASFPGANRFLELGVRLAGSGEPYTVLSPRQQLTATPYALRSATTTKADTATLADTATKADSATKADTATKADSATTADNATKADTATTATNATQLGGVAASQYVQTNDSRLTDARAPTAGSGNYIQSSNSPQAANFNINGNGTAAGTFSANVVNAATQYNIGGVRFLSGQLALKNTLVGIDSGTNTTGTQNSFFGTHAGAQNTSGAANSFFGSLAGSDNTTAYENSFFGHSAGGYNTSGQYNSFFGSSAGKNNLTGGDNSFFGRLTGALNQIGSRNSFFGAYAGAFNNTSDNAFFGYYAGYQSTGAFNSFFGANAGETNKAGNNNTMIGHLADVASDNLHHATAIGAGSVVGSSNQILLGRNDGSDDVRIPGTLRLVTLGSTGSVSLCRNVLLHIATCSSSLRYKTNIQPFVGGLAVINRLRPITFDWKQGGMHDVGFGAEEVAAVEPLLVTLNDKGEVEGVKYDRISVALVNAVKEQQRQIQHQQSQIDSLKHLVCRRHQRAAVCK